MKLPFGMFFALAAGVQAYQDQVEQAWSTWQELVQADLDSQPGTKGGFALPPKPAAAPARQVARSVPKAASPSIADRAMIGVTVWKLRPSLPTDPVQPRLKEIMHGPSARGASVEMTPARIGLDAEIGKNDHLVLAVSATRTGYLYIWSRERFENNHVGQAKLIFPTSRLRGGDNRIQAGRSIRIPDAGDDPPVFELVRKPGQKTEEVLVVVAPQPIAGISESNPISADQIAEWQKNWSSVVKQIDAREPKPMSAAELAALAGSGVQAIRPQRLYEVHSGPGQNLMVAVPLSVVD